MPDQSHTVPSEKLSVAITFPPKKFYLVLWILTFVIGIFGAAVASKPSFIFLIWIGVVLVALRQIWVTRWVQTDAEGIRVRNIAQRGRELRWEHITDVEERDISVRNKKSFSMVKITGHMPSRPGRPTTIVVDSDTVNFEMLRNIIRVNRPERPEN